MQINRRSLRNRYLTFCRPPVFCANLFPVELHDVAQCCDCALHSSPQFEPFSIVYSFVLHHNSRYRFSEISIHKIFAKTIKDGNLKRAHILHSSWIIVSRKTQLSFALTKEHSIPFKCRKVTVKADFATSSAALLSAFEFAVDGVIAFIKNRVRRTKKCAH